MRLEDLLVLVIEDGLDMKALIDGALCDGGYGCIGFLREDAISLLKGRQTKYRVLVTDINLAGKLDGGLSIALIKTVRSPHLEQMGCRAGSASSASKPWNAKHRRRFQS